MVTAARGSVKRRVLASALTFRHCPVVCSQFIDNDYASSVFLYFDKKNQANLALTSSGCGDFRIVHNSMYAVTTQNALRTHKKASKSLLNLDAALLSIYIDSGGTQPLRAPRPPRLDSV